MNLVRHSARRHTLVRLSMLVLLTVLISSAAAVASVTRPAVPELSDDFRADMARLADVMTYTGFVHFRSGGVDDHKRLLRAHGLMPADDFEVVDAWYAVGPVAAWKTLLAEPSISYLQNNEALKLHLAHSKAATRVEHAQNPQFGGPYRNAGGSAIDGSGVGVAVVDSGVDGTHPDFTGVIAKNFKVHCTTPVLVNTSGEFAGECAGPVQFTETPDSDSSSGHGTHVAGTVAGQGIQSNGEFVGVAPGVSLYGFGTGEGISIITLNAAGAFRWIHDNGLAQTPPIRVVTNSYGCDGGCAHNPNDVITKLTNKLIDKGISVLFSHGNDGETNHAGAANVTSGYATNPKPGVIGVANYTDGVGNVMTGDRNQTLSADSSRGAAANATTWPDISAPGTWITATCPHDKAVCQGGLVPAPYQPWYATISGTSMATPHVAAMVAMLYQADPALTPAQVENVIQDTAYKFGPNVGAPGAYATDPQNPDGTSSYDKGAGLLDAVAAFNALGVAKSGIGFSGTPDVTITSPAAGTDQDGVIAVSGTATDGALAPGSATLATGDAGDYSGPGFADIDSVSVSQDATGVTYSITVRNATDFGPDTAGSVRVVGFINGTQALTSIDCNAAGCQPRVAIDPARNTHPAASASRTGNTITGKVLFSSYGAGANSIAMLQQVISYIQVAQDIAPGGLWAESVDLPQYATPWNVNPVADATPTISVKVSVDGGPEQAATVTGSSPNYGWTYNLNLSAFAVGSHEILARTYINGARRDSDAVTVNIPARNSAVSLSTTALSFTDREIGTLSGAQTVTVTNTGTGPLLLGALSSDSDFPLSADTCSNASVAPAGSCSVDVKFGPSAVGARAGTLSIPSNAATSPDTVALSGTGLAPSITLSATSLTFGSEPVGSTSTAQSITVTNTGTSPLTIGTASFSGTNDTDFLRAADTCDSQTIAVGDSCSIDVTFAPTAAGSRSASLSIPSSAPNSPNVVTLSGTGVGLPSVSTNPVSHSFGNVFVGSAPSKTITVTNGGGLPLTIGTLSLAGTDPAEFALASNTCNGATLAPSASCSFAAKFVPTTSGVRAATVSIPSNAPGSPHSVPLDGTGVLGNPVAKITPSTVAFGGVISGQSSPFKSVSVQNTGTGVLSISSVTLGGADAGQFRKLNDSCTGKSLGTNQVCSMSVQFRPTGAGEKTADLTITTNAAASPHIAVLTGTGLVDEAAPETTITTEEGEILVAVLDRISGKVTDDVLGVSKVNVRFTSTLGTSTVTASLSGCNAQKTSCNWSATVPVTTAGPTVVEVWAVDAAGHTEDPVKQVAVVVI